MPTRQGYAGGIRDALRSLFPAAPAAAVPSTWSRRVLVAAAEVAAVVLGAAVLLLRIPGVPAWDTVFSEDYFEFLVGALQHPWHLLGPYNGYEQLLTRVVAQFVTYLPVSYAATAFACCGALTTAGCALFIFHASAGHVRSVPLRVLLAAAVVLLPIAPLEIADSTVDAPWYLLLALFWAVLWRPRTRTGMAMAAVVGFVTAASISIAIVFAPLLAIRAFALRQIRDQAVTAGWLAGCLVQLPVIVEAAVLGPSRLVGGQAPAFNRGDRLGNSLLFYLHDVVLRSVGWHLSWWLESLTTEDWATLIVGVALAVVLGVIVATQPGTRPFIAVAVATGLLFTVVSVLLTPWAAIPAVTFQNEVESRYTALPIFLIEAAFIVGADCALRRQRDACARQGIGQRRAVQALRPALAVTALMAFLAVGWLADFRYKGLRSAPPAHPWAPVAAQWQHDCQVSRTGEIGALVSDGHRRTPISCDHLRFLCPPRPQAGKAPARPRAPGRRPAKRIRRCRERQGPPASAQGR